MVTNGGYVGYARSSWRSVGACGACVKFVGPTQGSRKYSSRDIIKGMKILGIETSCDETAAAVVEDGVRILSNVVVSQIDIFAAYGGVIPEVAARSHLEAMMPVVDKALADAGCSWDEIDAIAVTYAPGLLGSLLIGTLTARTLAILHQKPLFAVHHLKAHVYANWLLGRASATHLSRGRLSRPSRAPEERLFRERFGAPVVTGRLASSAPVVADAPEKELSLELRPSMNANAFEKKPPQEPQFPILALVVSGGHTQILYMPGHNQFEIIGTTRDDAVGECFDKVAKILGLPYPGGPAIAQAAKGKIRLAREAADSDKTAENEISVDRPGDPQKYPLPHPKIEGLDFSFSGLKTAVLRAVQKAVGKPISFPSHQLAELLTPQQVADFAASFQETAVEILTEKLQKALREHPEVKSIVLAGGVAANEALREATRQVFSQGAVAAQNGGKTRQSGKEGALSAKAASHGRQKGDLADGFPVFFPAPALSGDNGAMVAAAAYFEILSGVKPTDPYKLNIYPRISIEA